MIIEWPIISIRGPMHRYRNRQLDLVTPELRQLPSGSILAIARGVDRVFFGSDYEDVIKQWDEFCATQTAT